jgi:putative SOS response-associated peptidase YedK
LAEAHWRSLIFPIPVPITVRKGWSVGRMARFTGRDGSPLLTAAGLWDEWKDRQIGERLKSCTMIITEPNDFAAEVHDRMPVFLSEQQFAPWLSGEAGAGILKPAPNDYLQRWPVSKKVNSSKADTDDPTLIEPVELATA